MAAKVSLTVSNCLSRTFPASRGGTGSTYDRPGPQHLLSPSPSLLPRSVPLNLTVNAPAIDAASWNGREAGAIYNPAVFTLRARPFIPGHLPEAHISLAQYMGLSTGLSATSSPPRGPGTLANQEVKPAPWLHFRPPSGLHCRGL